MNAFIHAAGQPCAYCRAPMAPPTRDHIHPRSKGGSFAKPGNQALVCEPCNTDKGSLTLRQFLGRLQRGLPNVAVSRHVPVQEF